MRSFALNALPYVLLMASGCSERAAPPANVAKAGTVTANEPSNGAYEQMQEMHRRVDRLANMTDAEREFMMRNPDRLRETENEACATGNPC